MKQCLQCGQPVKERTGREVKFCSVACFNVYQTKRKPKPCKHCGIEFWPPINHPKQMYCCTSCRDAAKTFQVERPCAYCGKTTKQKQSRANNLKHSYCCKACMIAHRAEIMPKGESHPQFVERAEYQCDYCGGTVFRLPRLVKQFMFCCLKCRISWQRESGYTTGEKSGSWLGGHIDSRGPGWRRQRYLARERDGFICQRCGKSEEDTVRALDVHHIKP